MSDVTEHPADRGPDGAVQTTPTEAPLGAMPSLSEPTVYRPMSVLALVGFFVSLLYTVGLIIAVLFALFTRAALLPSVALFIIPVIALGLCWAARHQVRRSEGTLSGEKFAAWGLAMTTLVTVLFGSYYLATTFAIRQQAADFADRWMESLKDGEPAQCYWYLIPPGQRMDVALPATSNEAVGMRAKLEMEFNSDNTRNIRYSEFRHGDVITLFRRGGKEIRVERIGVADPEFIKGGYEVAIRYRVFTPEMTRDLKVTVNGSEAVAGEYEGRQWYVMGRATAFIDAPAPTEVGKQHIQDAEMARRFADGWQSGLGRPARYKLSSHALATLRAASVPDAVLTKLTPLKNMEFPTVEAFVRALIEKLSREEMDRFHALLLLHAGKTNNDYHYLDTVPATERDGAKEALEKATVASFPGLAGADVLAAVSAAGRKHLVGRRRFDAGSLVQVDPREFYAPPQIRDDVEASVRRMFQPGVDRRRGHLTSRNADLPEWQEKDGHVFVSLGIEISVAEEVNGRVVGTQYTVDGQLVVEGVRSPDGSGRLMWQIHSVKLVSARRGNTPPGKG